MNAKLRQTAKSEFENIFFNWLIMLFWGKLWKMLENIGILNLPQPNKDETICCQNQITMQQIFSQNIY